MTQSRTILFNLLQSKLNGNSVLKQNTLQKIKEYWERPDSDGSLNKRAFDPLQFINLIPDDRFQRLLIAFMDLLDIFAIDKSSDAYLLANSKDRERVQTWALQIVEYACENLLEDNGSLNKKLIYLLRWHEYAADFIYGPQQIKNIVQSLAATLYQQITLNKTTKPYLMSDVYIAITGFINQNYGGWVNQEIDRKYQLKIDDSASVEVKAAVSVKKLLTEEINFEKLDTLYNQLLKTDKIERSNCHAFWLETMMQSVMHEKLFVGMWRVFSHHINPARDLPNFSEYERDQYQICKRRFLKFKQSASPSTVAMLERLSHPEAPSKETKLIKPPEEKRSEAKTEKIHSDLDISCLELPIIFPVKKADVTEVKRESFVDEEYFFVPTDTPSETSISQFYWDQLADLVNSIRLRL